MSKWLTEQMSQEAVLALNQVRISDRWVGGWQMGGEAALALNQVRISDR